jgi:hypothetical protein
MKSVGRFETGVALALLAVTSVLWLLAALFIFRVADVFHAYLMKFPGPWLTLGLMVVGPVVAMVLGVRTFCRTRARVMGATLASAGGLLLVAFGVVFGIPMLSRAIEPKTPKNPSTPRLFTPLAGLPVFPGAEGFGTDTPAGRGGRVLEVTTLADDGPGSLRAALNVPGNEGSVEPDTNDAVEILGKRGNSDGAHHVVLDHVSASWSEDETISTWYGAHDVTISWCIISEALNRSRHRKKTHSAGLLIGDSSYNVSVHHCLLAHNDFRNPLIMEGGTHDFVNNVVYDWGVLCAEVVDYESNSFLNFVGNAFLPGPSTKTGPYEILIEPEQGTPRIYVKDNIGPRRPDASVPDWNVVKYGWNSEQHAPESYHSSDAFAVPPVTTFDADEALEQVLAACGATRPVRDGVDRRVVAGVKNKTGAIIDSPADVGGYPELSAGTPPADRDHDAMPDEWETQKGLGADDPTDASGDLDGDGYTNLEEYLNSLVL